MLVEILERSLQLTALDPQLSCQFHCRCFNWFFPNSKEHGSYTENAEGFLLNGFKKSNVPDVIEVDAPIEYYRILIERNGNVIIKDPVPTP